jgi:hypothetical protein
MQSNVCAVCLEDLSADANTHTLGCGHVFHSRCIIGWFQRGQLSCPTCRADNRHDEHLSPMSLQERARFLRRTIGRRASAPRELKLLIAQLRKVETEVREHSREERSFRREHAAILRRETALQMKRYRLRRKVRLQERLIGLFQTPALTLPSLIVQRF